MTDWQSEIERRVRGKVTRDVILATRTAVRVGGPADLLVTPADPEALGDLLTAVQKLSVPLFVLGGGANTLVADAGFRGVVLRLLPGLPGESVEGERLVLSAGASTGRLCSQARKRSLMGMEFLAGIPGTLGGAIAMNAGTGEGEMKDIVERVEIATAEGVGFVPSSALAFGYRHASLPPAAVVTRVGFLLHAGSPSEVRESERRAEADREKRRKTQPLALPTFGSTFTNPPGAFAGELIEKAGLKGHRVGQAVISPLHANFISNLGGATASDVLALMRLARERVREATGIVLNAEVRLVGEFEPGETEGFRRT